MRLWRFLAGGGRFAAVTVAVFLLTALLAPFIANAKPIVILDRQSHAGLPRFPAWADWPRMGQNSGTQVDYRILAQRSEIVAIFPLFAYDPYETDVENKVASPSLGRFGHYLGTDDLGRDVAARLVHGTRNSMLVGLIAVAISFFIGVAVGAVAGYFGGLTDILISRIIEVVICFPKLILILAVLSLIKPSLFNVMLVIGLTDWTGIARVMRGEVLRRKNADFVTFARSAGAGHLRIVLRHILPNAMAPMLVLIAFNVADVILIESSLSFLGIGVPVPEPSWGDTLKTAQEYLDIAWWLTLFPGMLIFLTVLAYNRLGDHARRKFRL